MGTHFETLGLARAVDLDAALLAQRHKQLSLEFHPDRQGGADARARRVSAEKSTAINEAYRVLKDPYSRAFYLLSLHGVDLGSEDGAATQKSMPLSFLEEVMDKREALESARARKDTSAAASMGAQVTVERAAALEAGLAALRVLEAAPGDREALEKAAHQLGRVRYFTRFLEEVEAIEEEGL
jgi:molecular chaperone HscB